MVLNAGQGQQIALRAIVDDGTLTKIGPNDEQNHRGRKQDEYASTRINNSMAAKRLKKRKKYCFTRVRPNSQHGRSHLTG